MRSPAETKWRSARNGARLRQSRFEQPVIDRRHAEQHGRLEALHRLGDARRGRPALQQDVARAHAQRREHVADRIGEVKARGREQSGRRLRAAEHLLVIVGADADVAVMMLDRLRHAGRARRHHPERRIVRLARHRDERRGRRGLPGGQLAVAADAVWSAARPRRWRLRRNSANSSSITSTAGRTMRENLLKLLRRWRGSTSPPRCRPRPSRRDASRQCPACRASACRRGRSARRRPRAAPPRTG